MSDNNNKNNNNNNVILIFDLNKVLIYRKSLSSEFVLRPYVIEFLLEVSKWFQIGIWTSGKKKNVYDVIDMLFITNNIPLTFVWYQDKCINLHNDKDSDKPLFIKKLSIFWNLFKQFNQYNTVYKNNLLLIYY